MISNSVRSLLVKGSALLVSAAVTLAVSGCAMGTMELSGPAPNTNITISGTVHGGEQPVTGSNLVLWTVGTSGYGSTATTQMTSAVATDASGNFTLTGHYTCSPSNGLVYITASGGNPGLTGGTNNTAINLGAALGTCSSLTSGTNVTINEVTTTALAFALGQFFTTTFGSSSTDSFGAPNTTQAQVGIANAFGTYNNLVTNSTGTAITTASIPGNPSTLGTLTLTVESAKVNTIADILASCVSTSGPSSSNCSTLLTDVTPTGGVQPTDTLQAAVDMSLNPTSSGGAGSSSNLAALYALQGGTAGPFIGLTTAPADWTIGLIFSAGTTTTQTTINDPDAIAIDANGNVWITNDNSGTNPTGESMAGISPNGVLIANPFNSGATSPASMAATTPRNIRIDVNGNVIAATTSGSSYAFMYNPTTTATTTINVGSSAYDLAIDGSNDYWFVEDSTSSGANPYGISEFTSGTLATTNEVRYNYDTNSTLHQYAAWSTDGKLYEATGSSSAPTSVLVASGMNPGTCTTFPCTATNDTSLNVTYTTITTGATPYGLAAGSGGGMWVATNGVSAVSYISGGTATTYGSVTSFLTPRFVAVDGNNIAWFTNRGATSITEVTTAGTILSPQSATPANVGFFHSIMSTQNGIAIDPSGNVWVANDTATGAAANSVFEMVGAAAPTVTPISLALKNGTVGQKP